MSTAVIWCDYSCNSLRSWRDCRRSAAVFFCSGAPEPRKVWEQVKLKFSFTARIPRVIIPPATEAIRIITLSPVLHVQILTLSSTSLIFFLFIQSLNSMSPSLSNFNNSPEVGSEEFEPSSTYRTTVTLSPNTTDESVRDVYFSSRTSHVGFTYHLSKGLRSRD